MTEKPSNSSFGKKLRSSLSKPPNLTTARLFIAHNNPHRTQYHGLPSTMPSTIIKPSTTHPASKGPSSNFTGNVIINPVHRDTENAVSIALVTFTPGARTFWHSHEAGQLLYVLTGSGWICDRNEEPQRIVAGDTVWASPGTTHWHGTDDSGCMTHLAVTLGKATWHEEVDGEVLRLEK